MGVYELHTEVFNGPLELLLSLIEKRKLLINDIALAEVADDYLNYLKQHPEFPVNETAQFVLVGSTLLLIKSKSLLPVLSFTEEEQISVEDLEARLHQLRVFKDVSVRMQERFGKRRLYARTRVYKKDPVFTPDKDTSPGVLREAMRHVLRQLPKKTQKIQQTTVDKVISLEEMMENLTQRINASMQVSFREATQGVGPKVNVIVTFLAMLELVRGGVIRVEQSVRHGDIHMHTDSVGMPNYS